MARQRSKRKPVAEMNVVPYIDVMLVLLVIFMVTAPMLNQGINVDLPQVANEALNTDTKQQVLTISATADGSYYWAQSEGVDVDTKQDTAVTLDEMTDKVEELLAAAGSSSVQVVIRGDKAANYGVVVGAMSALQKAGVKNVGLITESP